jgi:hypothetical protein
MFYQTDQSEAIRLGDVIEGYISTVPTILSPCKPGSLSAQLCTISVGMPSYSIVISPCCSIEKGIIMLTPLIRLENRMFKLPHIREEPNRINSPVEPQYSVPPEVWDKPEFAEEKSGRLAAGPNYIFVEYFVYDAHEIFDEYTVHMRGEDNIQTRYYMIDFRNIYSLKCDMIKRPISESERPLIDSKRLELSVPTRAILREKLSYYFYRPAPEDAALLS